MITYIIIAIFIAVVSSLIGWLIGLVNLNNAERGYIGMVLELQNKINELEKKDYTREAYLAEEMRKIKLDQEHCAWINELYLLETEAQARNKNKRNQICGNPNLAR